jgi:isopentenyl-diphosphate delta-isomerase
LNSDIDISILSHQRRKEEHLQICLNEEVQFTNATSGLENYYLVHQALPEIDMTDIDLSIELFGKRLAAPIIISSMVGGIEEAVGINRNLARAAQHLGLAMGVGSERCLIESPEMAKTFRIRDVAPDILVFANLGAVQLNYGYGLKECLEVLDAVGADALILHLNPLQEALQPGGNTNFAGLLQKVKTICCGLSVPVVIKEVGSGISEDLARRLAEAGVSGIDVAGVGGTCWSEIERRRTHDRQSDMIAKAFDAWGIPTAESIIMARKGAPRLPIIGSGGIRTGVDIAKAIALGADAVGIATPLLKAARDSLQDVKDYVRVLMEVLRISMFCSGAENVDKLKHSPYLRKK